MSFSKINQLSDGVKSTLPSQPALWNYLSIAKYIQVDAIVPMLNCKYDWDMYAEKSTEEARNQFILATSAKIANEMKLASVDLIPGSSKYNEFLQKVNDSICLTLATVEKGGTDADTSSSDTGITQTGTKPGFFEKLPKGTLIIGLGVVVLAIMVFGGTGKKGKKRKK